MSELLIFSLNAIVIYFVADWLVKLVERKRGKALGQRQVVFFVIFLVLALGSFRVLQMVLAPG